MKLLVIIIFLNCFIYKCFSQKIAPLVYYTALNEVGTGIRINPGKKINYEISVGYKFALRKSGYYNGSFLDPSSWFYSMFRSTLQKGIIARPSVIFSADKMKYKYFGIVSEFGYLKSNNYIIDPGKFSGSNTTSYSQFKENYLFAAVGLKILSRIVLDEEFFWFLNLGLRYKYIDRKYSIQGQYNNQLPSDNKENFFVTKPFINVGFSYYFQKSQE